MAIEYFHKKQYVYVVTLTKTKLWKQLLLFKIN